MESVALAVLPREAAEDSDRSSDCSVVSEDQISSLPEVITDDPKEDYFFVPPDFHLHTNLSERDEELCLLDGGLFSANREHGTASVQLYGHAESCTVRLVQHYINLSRSKFPGGIFWINCASNDELGICLLEIARKYIWINKLGTMTDPLADFVTAWFEDRVEWLIVLNGVSPRWNLIGTYSQRLWLAPNSRYSSLIYIPRLHDGNIISGLPLDPMPLEIKPFPSTQLQSSDRNEEMNLSSGLIGARVTVDPTGTISTEAGPDTNIIDLGIPSDHDPNSGYRSMSDVYQDELYRPSGVRAIADPQARMTELQAKSRRRRSARLSKIRETAHQSLLSQQDLAPVSRLRSPFKEGVPFSSESLKGPLAISSGKSRADHSDKVDGPRSDGKPQNNSSMIDKNDKEDVPISNYVLVPESYHTSLLRTKAHSPMVDYSYKQYGTRPDHESQAQSPVGATFTLPYTPDEHYTPQLSGDTPDKLSDHSTRSGVTGFGISNGDVLSAVGPFDGPKSVLCEYPGCSVTSNSIFEDM